MTSSRSNRGLVDVLASPLDQPLPNKGSVESHLFGNPKSHSPSNEPQPDHQVGLVGAFKISHGVS